MTLSLDDRQVQAAAYVLDIDAETLREALEDYEPDRFPFRYADLSRLTGTSEGTLRRRVSEGYYTEGVDYERRGPRTVRFSKKAIR